MKSLPLLSLLVFAPAIGALVLALLRSASDATSRWLGLLFSFSTLALTAVAIAGFDPQAPGLQFVENVPWIASLGAAYHLGLDGMSLLLVLLTGLVAPASLAATWHDSRQPRLHAMCLLLLQSAALGVFLAQDFLPWFLFWELSLVPAFFLIKIWGGPSATRAAYQFFTYTMTGSAFMLAAFAALYQVAGTLDFARLAEIGTSGELASALGAWNVAVFVGVLVGLAVKAPLFPLHTWLPEAYAEAPAGTSMFLTAVMSKMGVYGFVRILWPIFPAELRACASPLLWLALGGVVFGALAAIRQRDLKRMIAYSSLNHVSYCLLALFAIAAAAETTPPATQAALVGLLLQMFNHGLSASALFFGAAMLARRNAERRGLDEFGGVRTSMPVFAGLFGIALFSSLGLPGLNGFIGEFLIFRGVFGLVPWAAAVAVIGLLATAWFLLTAWQKIFHGPQRGTVATFSDVSRLELFTLLPGVLLMLALGLAPQVLTQFINPLVARWVEVLP